MKTKIYLILIFLFISCESTVNTDLKKSKDDLIMTTFQSGYQRGILNYMRNGKFDTLMYKSDSLIIDNIIRK